MDKELILQTYAVCGNQRMTAERNGVCVRTVKNVLVEAEKNSELQKVRARAVEGLAGRVHGKAQEIIDSIAPQDIESGREFIRDGNGNLQRVVQWGPSLMQKVTSAAILTDKLKVLEDIKSDLRGGSPESSGMPLPSNVDEALRRIASKVKRLRILDVQFEDKHQETAVKLQDAATRAGLSEDMIEEAEIEPIIDLDNPGPE
ncbi:MAG: hypothetical protein AMJ55_02960 [Gammaproteobacteria bacterium SG8_15]|nr:MAG: hypothetical protein AMJ55_02960 [Gammaproteobacteria bacterium SG8_15]